MPLPSVPPAPPASEITDLLTDPTLVLAQGFTLPELSALPALQHACVLDTNNITDDACLSPAGPELIVLDWPSFTSDSAPAALAAAKRLLSIPRSLHKKVVVHCGDQTLPPHYRTNASYAMYAPALCRGIAPFPDMGLCLQLGAKRESCYFFC